MVFLSPDNIIGEMKVVVKQGKNNYKAFAKWVGDDRIVDDPDLVASEYAVHSAVFYWDKNKLNKVARLQES